MKRFLYLGVALFLIVFEAVPEGLALAGHKTIAGIIEFVFLAGITLTVFAYFAHKYNRKGIYWDHRNNVIMLQPVTMIRYLQIVIGYVLLRVALFSIVHNIAAGLPVFYLGTTKLFDIIMTPLASWGWFMCFVGGIVGLCLLLKK